jgi:A/G-specific adenine glycosylase
LGATLCKPRNPECTLCPFNHACVAYTQNRVGELPTAKLKKTLPTKTGHFLWLPNEANVMLSKRPDRGIWASLWCLPEVPEAPTAATLVASFKHTFSHYKLTGKVWQPEAAAAVWRELAEANSHYQRAPINLQNIHEFGLPAPMLKLLYKLLQENRNG